MRDALVYFNKRFRYVKVKKETESFLVNHNFAYTVIIL